MDFVVTIGFYWFPIIIINTNQLINIDYIDQFPVIEFNQLLSLWSLAENST